MNVRRSVFSIILALTAAVTVVNASGEIAPPVIPCDPDPVLYAENVDIMCESKFDAAHSLLQTAFESISAYDACLDVDHTARIRVKQINWVRPNGDYRVLLDLEEIAGAVAVFAENEYDYTVKKTQKLFHYQLLFKPGVYEVFYHILDEDDAPIDAFRATRKQIVAVGKNCDGTFGCLRCDGCASCRDAYIPDFIQEQTFKRFLGDWLLIGVSVLVLLSATGLKQKL